MLFSFNISSYLSIYLLSNWLFLHYGFAILHWRINVQKILLHPWTERRELTVQYIYTNSQVGKHIWWAIRIFNKHMDEPCHPPSPLLWVRALPPPSCNSSALIMTSVKQGGIANEQELIGPSHTKWLHSSTMNYKTGGRPQERGRERRPGEQCRTTRGRKDGGRARKCNDRRWRYLLANWPQAFL